MRLNELSPAEGSRPERKRVGRGIGSGLGKTAGRGHKGQKARSGGFHKVGFEGGQMPLQRRLPKFGFKSRKAAVTAEVRLGELDKVVGDEISLESLKAARLVPQQTLHARIMLSGEIARPVHVRGVKVTIGARAAIEQVGGSVA